MMRAAAIVIILLSPVIKCFNPKSLNETKIMGVNILGNNYTTQERRSLSELSLVYYGGPVLSAIHVVPVFYNSLVLHQSEILNYYGALISGGDFIAFIDAEYGTQSGSKVNYGTVDSPRNLMLAQSEQSDEQIRAILVDMFSKDTPAVLPSPTANTVYAIHMPPNVRVADTFHTYSCQMWCSYHSSFLWGSTNIYYIIVPDQGGPCSKGCGSSVNPLDNLYSIISHEVAEAITNPAVGIASGMGPPLSWWSQVFGEVADACGDSQDIITLGDGNRYTVHQLWSNSKNKCDTPV